MEEEGEEERGTSGLGLYGSTITSSHASVNVTVLCLSFTSSAVDDDDEN